MSGHSPLHHHRGWFAPPDAITERTGITQVMRKLLRRLVWTGPVRMSELPHPRRALVLEARGFARIDGDLVSGTVSLTEKGRAALAEVARLEREIAA